MISPLDSTLDRRFFSGRLGSGLTWLLIPIAGVLLGDVADLVLGDLDPSFDGVWLSLSMLVTLVDILYEPLVLGKLSVFVIPMGGREDLDD